METFFFFFFFFESKANDTVNRLGARPHIVGRANLCQLRIKRRHGTANLQRVGYALLLKVGVSVTQWVTLSLLSPV